MARILLGNIKGPKGDTGPQGKAGYTPVKGTDYFTEEDIAALKELFAPSGYGVGEDTKQIITYDQIDFATTTGLYWVNCPGKTVENEAFDNALLWVMGRNNTNCVQQLFPIGLNLLLIRQRHESGWSDGWGKIAWQDSTILGG